MPKRDVEPNCRECKFAKPVNHSIGTRLRLLLGSKVNPKVELTRECFLAKEGNIHRLVPQDQESPCPVPTGFQKRGFLRFNS